MAKYFYTAKTSAGEDKTGEMEAKDERQLARTLREQGLILIRLETKDKSGRKNNLSLSIFGPSLSEKMFFTRNLQVMISAGLPLPRALETLASQTKNDKFKKAILNIKEEITCGKNFSEAVAKYPGIFSLLFQNMIKSGEEGGMMEDVLKTLALQMEKENDLKGKIKGALIYPSVIIATMIGIGILMLVVVIPQLSQTFKELGIQLPFTTKIVIGLADFLIKKWYLAIIISLGSAFLIFLASKNKTGTGKKIIDALVLKLPVISPIIKNTNSAYTARTLSSLVAAGVHLPKALEITADTLGNIYYQQALRQAVGKVSKGQKLSEALQDFQKIYPQTLIQMISVGEETGETAGMLQKLADFYEEEVAKTTKNLTSVIEPVLMVLIGSVIGFFAISMIQPLYSMLGAIE
ncbi:MAG: type II secretion system F family protein [Patescibacteria group bacterium]